MKTIVLIFCLIISSCYPTYWEGIDSHKNRKHTAVVFGILSRYSSSCGLFLTVEDDGERIAKSFIQVDFSKDEEDNLQKNVKILAFNDENFTISYYENKTFKIHTWNWARDSKSVMK